MPRNRSRQASFRPIVEFAFGGADATKTQARLRSLVPNVFGGCCGTDHRHIEQICDRCSSRSRAA